MDKMNPKDTTIMALNDDDLDKVTGGSDSNTLCPYCRQPTVNGYCENLGCYYYGSVVV